MSTVELVGTHVALWCIAKGSPNAFKVTAGMDNDISDLKELIWNKKPNDFANVDPDNLTLWRVDVGQNAINTIKDMLNDNNKLLISGNTVGVTFHPIGGTNIRVVVEVGSSKKRKITDESLNRFWISLKDATCDKFLNLSENTQFLGKKNGPSVLFIRKCYRDLQTVVFNTNINKLRITGNPGIGKTYFGYYLLYLLAQQNQTIVYDNASETKPIIFEGENATKSNSDDIELYLANQNVWYIVDGKEPSDVNAKTILICSPKKSHYQHFDKYYRSTSRFMPIWNLKEINLVRDTLYKNTVSKKRAASLFLRWGGIPRFVLQNTDDITQQNKLDEAISCVNEVIFDYVGESIVGMDEVSHKIVHIHVNLPIGDDDDDDGNVNNDNQPLLDKDGNEPYTSVIVRFASEYVMERVTEQYEARIRERLRAQIKAGVGNSLLGNSFEYIAHRILRNGGRFEVRPLDSYDPNFNDPRADVNLPQQKKILKFSRNSIDYSIVRGKYFQPKEKNFPSIDSIIAPNRVFHMTITKDHPIKTLGLDLLCNKLGGKSGEGFIYYYFVVPAHLYDDFKVRRFDAKRIPDWMDRRVFQYVLKIQL